MKLVDISRYASGHVLEAWAAAQVELHGKYSVEKTRRLHRYSAQAQWPRVLMWSIITPIPCLLINTVTDIAPLAKPSEGRDANYVFWVRCYAVVFFLIYGIYRQVSFLAPSLDFTQQQIVFSAFIVTSICLPYNYVVAGFVGMPVPFMLLTGTPIFLFGTAGVLYMLFGRKLRNDRMARALLFRALAVINIQLGLTVVYPVFIYGCNSLPPRYQTPYMILLPLIKIAAKNAMSKIVGDNDDVKPEVVIFNIEIFNALYVSLAMGRASNWSTSLILIAMDVIQAWISVYDLHRQARHLNRLRAKLPACYRQEETNYLDVAIALMNATTGGVKEVGRSNNPTKDIIREAQERISRTNKATGPHRNKIFTFPPSQSQPTGLTGADVTLKQSFASAAVSPLPTNLTVRVESVLKDDASLARDREKFLRVFANILFTVEFITLIEYTEIIIPAFYGLYMTAMYYLPNREFYPALAHIDEDQLQHMISNVFMYASLELLSFVGIAVVVQRLVGISAMHQLGFVLETQWDMVQSKLLAWIFYAVQNSLEHFGADFSFQFAWLRHPTSL